VRKPSNHADNESKPGSANAGARSVIAIKTQRRQDGAATEKTSAEKMNNVGLGKTHLMHAIGNFVMGRARRRDNKY
jgi:hypothetical protein